MPSQWLRRKLLAKENKRLPLKHPPLKVPAQELRSMYEDRLLDVVLFGVGILLFVILILAGVVWILTKVGLEFSVIHIAAYGIVIAVPGLFLLILIYHFRKSRKELQNFYLGIIAETFVGQQLERTRAFGCSVFHDFIHNNENIRFNIDHIVIGRFGIAVIETKGRSKPMKGDTLLWATNDKIQFCDGTYTKSPVTQARANERCVREILFNLLSQTDNKNL